MYHNDYIMNNIVDVCISYRRGYCDLRVPWKGISSEYFHSAATLFPRFSNVEFAA